MVNGDIAFSTTFFKLINYDRPLSRVQLTGKCSKNQFETWLTSCMPGVPNRTDLQEVTLLFESTFLGTQIEFTYR